MILAVILGTFSSIISVKSVELFIRIRNWLGLERNILVMLMAILLLGMGEELWSRFIPKYLEVLGASAWAIALYGTLRHFLDAVYQYPGGWLADHLGRRTALVIFTLLAIIGYILYILGATWLWILVGTIFVMAWSSLTLPAFFAIIGDNLPQQRRAIGFGVQSFLRHIPMVVAPFLGGILVSSLGFGQGIHLGLVATIALAIVAIFILLRFFSEERRPRPDRSSFRDIWRGMDVHLKRLLFSDCLIRWAEGIPEFFIVLYTLNVLGASAFQFGWLTSIQMATSLLLYIPVAKYADRSNPRPFVLMTFAFFALFPLALVTASSLAWITVAFVIAGLREVGEPARKALIVDLAMETARGRAIGMYYLIRGLVVFPAPLVGGWLWNLDHRLPFYAALVVGLLGLISYAALGVTEKRVTALK